MDNFLDRIYLFAKIKVSLIETKLELTPEEKREYDRQQKELKHPAFHDFGKCGQKLLFRVIKKKRDKQFAFLKRLYCPTHHLYVDTNGWEKHWGLGIYTPPPKKIKKK